MHPCATCALIQRTCCQRAEVAVTRRDVERIADHLGHDGFWHRARPADPEVLIPDPDDPAWFRGTVAPDGTRRILRKEPDGSCSLLGATGCSLPEGVRPLICRLYPFAYTERGLEREVADHHCPTAALAPPGRTMLDVLGMDASAAESWRRRLYEELGEETHTDARRTHVRSAG